MQFASSTTARTYSDRSVDKSWNEWACAHLHPSGKDVVDIGCGGGIYSRGFEASGARSVVGVDQSKQYIDEARSSLPPGSRISFQVGSAENTQLPAHCADLVFERALIHHLSEPDKRANALEAQRLLRAGGLFAVQDRTMDDVLSTRPENWIRASLFEAFPALLAFEQARRPSRKDYTALLLAAGFSHVRELGYVEVRKTYTHFGELRAEILSRKGKSILFELTDAQLAVYCARLEQKAQHLPLEERDAWTIWLASR